MTARQKLGLASLKKNTIELRKKTIETEVALMHKLIHQPILDHAVRVQIQIPASSRRSKGKSKSTAFKQIKMFVPQINQINQITLRHSVRPVDC